MLSPYQFASNSPIMSSDVDGLEAKLETIPDAYGNIIEIAVTVDAKVIDASMEKADFVLGIMNLVGQQIEESFNGHTDFTGASLPISFQLNVDKDILRVDEKILKNHPMTLYV